MTKKELLNTIELAIENDKPFIAVAVKCEHSPGLEIIANRRESLEYKLNYYNAAYNDDLTLKNNKSIRIVSCISLEDLSDIVELYK